MISGKVINIQHFCIHDGPGIRTTVFLKGCPLKCLWCSNPNSQKYESEIAYAVNKCILCKRCISACKQNALVLEDNHIEILRDKCTMCTDCFKVCPGNAIHYDGKLMTVEEVIDEVVADMNFYHNSGGGMTLSGGEAVTQKEFSIAILEEAKRMGVHTAMETSAYTSTENFCQIIKFVDHLFIDLKHFDAKKHKYATGVDNKIILENIVKAQEIHPNVNIRIPVIPSINDNKEDLGEMAKFLESLNGIQSIELLQYHDLGSSKYAQVGTKYPLQDVEKYDLAYLSELVDDFRKNCSSKTITCQAS